MLLVGLVVGNCVLGVVLVEPHSLVQDFLLCSPLLLQILWLAVLFPLLFVHCLFRGLRIRRHRIVLTAGFF